MLKTRSLDYISIAENMAYLQPLLRNGSQKLPDLAKSHKITPFTLIQGHRVLYQSKTQLRLSLSE